MQKITNNQYVVFKHQDEWQEGRIVDYTTFENKIIYNIYSLKYCKSFSVQEHILISSPENIKRVLKDSNAVRITKNETFLEILNYDEAQSKIGLRYSCLNFTLQKILELFIAHLLDNKLYLTKEEIFLSIEGLKDIIKEIQGEINYKLIDEEGVIGCLKLCYLTVNYLLTNENIMEVKNFVQMFCVYLLDFLLVNINLFYDKNMYI
ncbi:hypothetical protein NCER_101702 [Vairimorpha ceranae BRL01]|uniref:Uncharacterized protein n=1 Tax=Vairimorpha ceranae (strain BRL01) TaxID=578460 RepID=C4VAL0_VAIC1|nr:hypothetical protein NCER_101702 [Vairimorpha ceranae BRL01]